MLPVCVGHLDGWRTWVSGKFGFRIRTKLGAARTDLQHQMESSNRLHLAFLKSLRGSTYK